MRVDEVEPLAAMPIGDDAGGQRHETLPVNGQEAIQC